MFKYFTVFLFFSIIHSTIFAEPAPFGLEINKSTYKEVKQKYSGVDTGINKYSMGKMYDINSNQLDIEGVKNATAIFDKEENLLALITTFNKSKYANLVSSLSQKYQLVSKQDAFVGNKFARFQTENTIIDIEAPHMSFDLTLSYMHKNFKKLFLDQSAQESKQKKEKEKNSL